jgi:hypothetical protein
MSPLRVFNVACGPTGDCARSVSRHDQTSAGPRGMLATMTTPIFLKRAVFLTALSGLIIFAAPSLRAADRLPAGQYKLTITAAGTTQTMTLCLTPEDARNANADAKAGREFAKKASKGACTIKAYEVKGNKVTYTMACGNSVTTSTTTYHGDGYEKDTTTTVGKSTRTSHLTAKRVGACK